MLNKNVIKNTVFGIGGSALSIYALRSYGYQKECQGYISGCKVMLEAQTGNKTAEEKDKLIKENEPTK